MNSKKGFTVKNYSMIFKCCIFILAFFVILVLLYTIFSSPPHTAMYVCITIFVFIPGTMLALWTKMFRINVNGTKVSVRKCLGLVHFSFEVSDIVKVEWKTVETAFGENEIVTIFTLKKKVSIETLMENSSKMKEFILENVDESKINKSYRALKKHKP